MVLPIVKYGNPVLRIPGKPVVEVTPDIRELAADMIETMREADGVGLAAHQIGRAIQLCVIEIPPQASNPGDMMVNGMEADIASHMPLVLINPILTPTRDRETAQEGCLSFPEIRADITRPAGVQVRAQTLEGPVAFDARGLLARAIQHEVDHLRGVLFIDRMTPGARTRLARAIQQIENETQTLLKKLAARK